jgi:hypothetical protein
MMKQRGQQANANIDSYKENSLQKISNGSDPILEWQGFKDMTDSQLEAKLITPPEHQKSQREYRTKSLSAIIGLDIQNNPMGAIENIDSGYYNKVAKSMGMQGLPEPEKYKREAKVQMATDAQILKDQNAAAFRSETKQVMDMVAQNGIGSVSPEDLGSKKMIDPENTSFYNSLENAYNDPTVRAGNTKTDVKVFNDLAEKAADPRFSQTMLRTLVAKNLKNLSREDVKKLMPQAEAPETPEESPVRQQLNAAMTRVKNWVAQYGDGSPAVFKQLSGYVLQASDPLAAAEKAIRQQVLKWHPELGQLKDIPDSVMSAEGGFKRIYDQQNKAKKK